MDSRTRVAVALGVAFVLIPSAVGLTRPQLFPTLAWVAAAVAVVGCLVASARSHGLSRAGWASAALSMAFNATGNYLAASPGFASGVAVSALYAAAAIVLSIAFVFFMVSARKQVLAALLHLTIVITCMWIIAWQLDVQAWTSGSPAPDTAESVLSTLGLTTGLAVAMAAWLLVVPAYAGRHRGVMGLAGMSALAAAVGDWLAYLLIDERAWTLSETLWVAQPALLLAAALLVAIDPPMPLRRTLLRPHRDLVIVSLLVMLVAVVILGTAEAPGLSVRATRASASAVIALVVLHIYEIRRHRRLAGTAEEQARHMQVLVSETRDIIIELDHAGQVLFASAALSTILGLRESDLTGQHISDVLPDVSPEVLEHLTYAPTARMQSTLRLESALTTTSAAVVHVESVITPLSSGYLVAVRDVTERVGLQSRLQQVTYHDVVTGLPNRTSLDRAVRSRLYESTTGEISLLLVDIAPAGLADNAVGDDSREELLRTVARTIRATIRTGDSLARFSDQRFAVLLRQGTDPMQAEVEAHRIVDALNRHELVPDVTLRTCGGLCVGGHTGLELVRNAELALRQATREGPGTVQVFEPAMLAQFARTRNLRRRLARPPAPDRWTVLYQPIINLRTEEMSGVEALLRWTDPEGDFIGIEEVIRLAEEFGSILQIGTWVLEQSVAQAMEWYRMGRRLTVAVNISVHQLVAPDFTDIVHRVLDESGLPPELLILEITETVVLEQTDETVATLEDLRALGIRVAIDDFGTGYSGLANLRSLPLDILKIDRTFVQGLGDQGGDEAVVAAVSRLGRELGLTITAEGIETRAQEAQARMLGITAAQGYLYARPLPAAQILPLADQLAGEISLEM